jgi:hypothetical protein
MVAEGPVRQKYRWLIPPILDRLPGLVKTIKACQKWLVWPFLALFDPTQLPLPERILAGESTEIDRHLQTKK